MLIPFLFVMFLNEFIVLENTDCKSICIDEQVPNLMQMFEDNNYGDYCSLLWC